MYTLYWSPGSASMAPHCCLEEAGAAYTLKLVDTGKDEHRQPEYLALNPAGKVPVLVIAGGSVTGGSVTGGFTMTESAAMCMLIADRHPGANLAPQTDDPARGHYYMWLTHLTNTLQPAMLRYYYADRYTAAEGSDAVVAKAMEEVAAVWSRIDAHLRTKGPYLLGERYSAADIFCTMLSLWQDCCPDTYRRFPGVKRLADLVMARPAIARIAEVNQAA